MSATTSQWGRGFKSRFLAKSEFCRIFLLYIYLKNRVFRPHQRQTSVRFFIPFNFRIWRLSFQLEVPK
jgi:hypothetical protein